MDETDPANQGEDVGQKLQKLEHELEGLEKKTSQEVQQLQKVPTPEEAPITTTRSPGPAEGQRPSPSSLKPTPPPTNKSRIVLWIGLGFLALALVGIGAYYLDARKATITPQPYPIETFPASPTPTPETTGSTEIPGWKTYTDDKQKYSFSFPPNWILNTGNPNQLFNYGLESVPRTEFDPELDKDKVKIEIYTSSNTYDSLEVFVEEEKKTAGEGTGKTAERDYETIFIGGQRAVKTIDYSAGLRILILYVQNPSTKLMHTFVAMPRYDLNTEVVDQILSTFKFLESPSTPTSSPSGTIQP